MGHVGRPFCLVAFAALLAAVPVCANTLPNGLQLERFEVSVVGAVVVGATVRVEMTLKNLEPKPIRFEAPGLFVAARTSDLSDRGNRDFGHSHGQGYTLGGGQTVTLKGSRTLDAAGTWHFWPGFKMNGAWGPFRWMEKTLQVGTPGDPPPPPDGPVEDGTRTSEEGGILSGLKERLFGGSALSVAQLLADPAKYDGKSVTFEAHALIVRKQPGGLLVSLSDCEQSEKVLSAFGPGTTAASNGDKVRVAGVFKRKSLRGRYTYDNEVAMASGGLTVVAKGYFLEQGTSFERLDYRSEVRAPFDPAAKGARLSSVGQAVTVRFHTRLYTNSPKAHTLVRQGNGTAAYQVARWETGKKLMGKGIGSPGQGLTWLAVHLKFRGDAKNQGEPDRWFQFPAGQDPAPCFFVTGRGGQVYWPDTATLVVVNRDRTYTNSDRVRLDEAAWRPSALAFKIPEGLQDPVFVCVTWNGGSRFEYTGVALR